MKNIAIAFLMTIIGGLSGYVTFAQTPAPQAKAPQAKAPQTTATWYAKLTKGTPDGNSVLESLRTFSTDRANPIKGDEELLFRVDCVGMDCATLTLTLHDENEPSLDKTLSRASTPDGETALATDAAYFTVKGKDVVAFTPELVGLVFKDGSAIANNKATVKVIGKDPKKKEKTTPKNTLLGCLEAYTYPGLLYDEAANEAVFIVSATGDVVGRPTESIDENDKITVRIVGPRDVLEDITVQRKSAFREIGTFSILGANATGTEKLKVEAAHESECGEKIIQLADFAPGRGQVQLSRLDANGRSTPFNDFDFAVNKLYRGAFSFGPVYSWLTDRSFGTVDNGSNKVITITEQSPQVHYVISYTHYIWGRRDEEKPNRGSILKQLYPTLGLSVQNTLRNVFAGVTYDILNTNVYVTAGAHIGKVTVIDPTSKLGVGDVLPASLSSVPTRSETNVDWFIGLSLDLRAATQFLGLFGTGTATAVGH